jgi:two-component system nitrate/nitrite response regulator NarL
MREVQILACLVAGHPNKVISRQLAISEATVKVHVKAILRKVGVQNRTQAAIWAMSENVPSADKDATDHECTGHCGNGHS